MKISSTTVIDLTEEDIRQAIADFVKHQTVQISVDSIQFRSGNRAMKDGALSARVVSNAAPVQTHEDPSEPAPEPSQLERDVEAKAIAEELGRKNKTMGVKITDNPYPENSIEGQAWLKGWTGG